jgi:parvulin-like peptidyl-prolyl isomerase
MALVVNGEKIEDSAIKQEVERLRPDYERVFADQKAEEREAQLLEWSRENMIEKILISQEAQKNGDKVPPARVQEALARLKEQYDDPQQLYKDLKVENDEQIKEEIEKQMRVEQRIEQVYKNLPKPSQEDIRKYYEENQDQFKSGERLRVAHIVKYVNWQTDEQTAYEAISRAYEELENGTAFEVVVDKYTDCADSGGDLGFVIRGQMVEEFEDVVFNLGAGQVSDIFRTRFGFHIAKVYSREPATVAAFEDVKSRVTELVKEKMRSEALDSFIDGLKSEAKIEEI